MTADLTAEDMRQALFGSAPGAVPARAAARSAG